MTTSTDSSTFHHDALVFGTTTALEGMEFERFNESSTSNEASSFDPGSNSYAHTLTSSLHSAPTNSYPDPQLYHAVHEQRSSFGDEGGSNADPSRAAVAAGRIEDSPVAAACAVDSPRSVMATKKRSRSRDRDNDSDRRSPQEENNGGSHRMDSGPSKQARGNLSSSKRIASLKDPPSTEIDQSRSDAETVPMNDAQRPPDEGDESRAKNLESPKDGGSNEQQSDVWTAFVEEQLQQDFDPTDKEASATRANLQQFGQGQNQSRDSIMRLEQALEHFAQGLPLLVQDLLGSSNGNGRNSAIDGESTERNDGSPERHPSGSSSLLESLLNPYHEQLQELEENIGFLIKDNHSRRRRLLNGLHDHHDLYNKRSNQLLSLVENNSSSLEEHDNASGTHPKSGANREEIHPEEEPDWEAIAEEYTPSRARIQRFLELRTQRAASQQRLEEVIEQVRTACKEIAEDGAIQSTIGYYAQLYGITEELEQDIQNQLMSNCQRRKQLQIRLQESLQKANGLFANLLARVSGMETFLGGKQSI